MTAAGSEEHKRLIGIQKGGETMGYGPGGEKYGEHVEIIDKAETDIIEPAKALCEKFINKVETGRARSHVTYADCKALLKAIYRWEEKNADKSGG